MKRIGLVLIILLIFIFSGCKNHESFAYEGGVWKEDTFFNSVYPPKGDITRLTKDYDQNGRKMYTVLVNEFSYDDFYEYISALESIGFNYEFFDEYVPSNINSLIDKTETSWTASLDNIYIIANWRSDSNKYYNGYNLQLLFYNYDYLNN